MANLFNKYIYETYKSIVGIGQSGTSGLIPGTIQPLTDGEGNELPIRVSDTEVEVDYLTSKNLFIEAYGEVIDQNGVWVGPQQGFSGTSGTSGTDGAAGTSGTSGVNGSSGQTGSAGTSGTSGTRGTSGTAGTSGTSGIGSAGTSGTSGINGGTGSSGTSGQAGSSGTSGLNGTSGANGSSGTSGISQPGTPGTSGTSGINGSAGTSGTSGTSGSNGISSGQVYYFNQSQTSDVSGYKVLSPTPNGTQQIVTTNLTGSQQNAQVSQFITAQLGFGVIPGGTQRFHLHYLKQASNDNIEAYVTIQLADSSGTIIGPVITSGISSIGWVDASTPAEVTLDLTLPTTSIDPTSRMIVKLYLNNNNSAAHVVNWYTEGTQYYSFVVTTVGAIAGTSGTSGVNGTSGLNGTSGTSGAQGAQGAQGAAGTSGTNGSSGTSGIGQDGTSGTSGAAGTSGTSGTSGGGGVNMFNSIKAPSTMGGFPFYKLNVPAITFSGATQTLSVGATRFIPVQSLVPGEVIKDVAILVAATAQAGSTITLGLYTCTNDANGNFYADTLVTTFGSVDSSTTGRKTITNVNFTVPTSPTNMYYVGILQVGGAAGVGLFGATNSASVTYYGSLDSTTMTRSMSVNSSVAGQTVLPTTISSATWAGYSNNTTFTYVGFKS